MRSDDGREALNPDNLMCRAIRAIKQAVPDIGILTDVALDPYTAHGHDGLVDDRGYVLNDATVEVLVGQALNQAAAGGRGVDHGARLNVTPEMLRRCTAIRKAVQRRAFNLGD